jgi:hypothetical protein
MNLGGESSRSSSSSQSESQGTKFGFNVSEGGSFLDRQQQYNQQGLVNQFQGGFNKLNQSANANMRAGQRMLRQGKTSLQGQQGFLGGLQESAQYGQQALQQFSQQQNPYLNSQVSQLGQDIGSNFREQILPGIGGGFQNAGQRGSSRQGVAEGLAAQGAQEQFQRGATNLRAGAYGQQQQAAAALAGLGNQANQAFGQQQAGWGQQVLGATGLSNQALQNNLNPFQIGAAVIGSPTALQFQNSFGMEQAQQTASSTSSGKGSSNSLNMGFI